MNKRIASRLAKGEIRVIKVGWNAVYELIRETFMNDLFSYFDLNTDRKTNTNQNVIVSFDYQPASETLIVLARNFRNMNMKQIPVEIKDYFNNSMKTTTDTLIKPFAKPLYETLYYSDYNGLLSFHCKRSLRLKKRNSNGLHSNELRIIKVKWNTVYKWLCNTIINDSDEIFCVKNTTNIKFFFDWDNNNQELVVCAYEKKNIKIDLKKFLNENVNITTESFFGEDPMYADIYLPKVFVKNKSIYIK